MENRGPRVCGRNAQKYGLHYSVAYGAATAALIALFACGQPSQPSAQIPPEVVVVEQRPPKIEEQPATHVSPKALLDWHVNNVNGLLKKKEEEK